MTATEPTLLVIPELGPSLGRLVAPAPSAPGTPPAWIVLEDLRVALVTQLFELAGDARRWAAEGERELALTTLNREALEGAWLRAVTGVAERAATAINERLLAAAAEARVPRRRIRTLGLDAEEIRALAGRLRGGDARLEEALTALERAASPIRSERAAGGAVEVWQHALLAVARRLEASWLALEDALAREWRDWAIEVAEIRAWRRPRWPLVAYGVVLVLGFGYAGLVLGGYLPVPDILRRLVEAIWARWS